MRNLNSVEMKAISGAVINYGRCTYYVSSLGIPNNEFVAIEKYFQLLLDDKISPEKAVDGMIAAGVSEHSFNTYVRHFDETFPICR